MNEHIKISFLTILNHNIKIKGNTICHAKYFCPDCDLLEDKLPLTV
jgi:hypothetical protein